MLSNAHISGHPTDKAPTTTLIALPYFSFAAMIFERASMSLSESIGFVRCPSIPASRQRTLSSVKAFALMARWEWCAHPRRESERMARVASIPVHIGHHDVHENQVERAGIGLLERTEHLEAIICARHLRTRLGRMNRAISRFRSLSSAKGCSYRRASPDRAHGARSALTMLRNLWSRAK